MKRLAFAAAGLAVVAALAAPAPAQFTSPALAGASGAVAAALLAAHNHERAMVGHPPLQWDPELAASAASYGPQLARLRRLVHSPRDTRPGQRENLAMASHGQLSPEELVGLWRAEKKMLRPGRFPDVSSTGNWADVAHYTQMVWRTTTRVGCAVHSESGFDYLICRYTPPGNIDGKPVVEPMATLASR